MRVAMLLKRAPCGRVLLLSIGDLFHEFPDIPVDSVGIREKIPRSGKFLIPPLYFFDQAMLFIHFDRRRFAVVSLSPKDGHTVLIGERRLRFRECGSRRSFHPAATIHFRGGAATCPVRFIHCGPTGITTADARYKFAISGPAKRVVSITPPSRQPSFKY